MRPICRNASIRKRTYQLEDVSQEQSRGGIRSVLIVPILSKGKGDVVRYDISASTRNGNYVITEHIFYVAVDNV